MAGEVLWHVTMSLDGFITGPDDSMEWAFAYKAPNATADDVMRSTGAILAGRRWYDVATARYHGREGIYGGRWTGEVFVLTHRPPDEPAPGVTFLSSRIDQALAAARAAARGANVEIFGADVARQCLDEGLVDELVVHLAPVLLGDGVRLYGGPGSGRIDLERTTAEESGQLTSLRFRVAKGGRQRAGS
jgi:dihydrofolate reductase